MRGIRNRIVHPKSMNLGDELIIRDRNGNIRRKVSPDEKVADGDVIFISYGTLLDEFNAGTAAQAVSRTLAALRVLRDSAGTDELNWIYDIEQQFGWLS